MPIPLLLDTDIGDDVDDVFALLLAALHPDLALQAVTVVFGDVAARARLARKMLNLAGRPDIPVAVGHGTTSDGWNPIGQGGATMASAQGALGAPGSVEWEQLGAGLAGEPAVELIVRMVREATEPPVLAAIGPLTNLAAAFRQAPDLAQRVRAVVLMGGRLGDETGKGEHNFNCDPAATRAVLESGAPLKLGTYEITCQAQLTGEHLPRLRRGSPACRSAADQLEVYLQQRGRSWTSMYDPLSLTLAYTDRYLAMQPVALRVATETRRAVLATDPAASPTAEASIGVDAPAFVEHLLSVLGV